MTRPRLRNPAGANDGGKETPVSSGAKSGSENGSKSVRPVNEVVALSNKLFFQTAVVRYGSWERFLEKHGQDVLQDEAASKE